LSVFLAGKFFVRQFQPPIRAVFRWTIDCGPVFFSRLTGTELARIQQCAFDVTISGQTAMASGTLKLNMSAISPATISHSITVRTTTEFQTKPQVARLIH
jgi:post-segregation antitoxin (ccd killing protein)